MNREEGAYPFKRVWRERETYGELVGASSKSVRVLQLRGIQGRRGSQQNGL